MTKYQVAPPFGKEDFEKLKDSIRKHGVIVPVEYDEEDEIVDGHHRVRACKELGITDWPRKVRSYQSDGHLLEMAWSLNAFRRHLSRAEKDSMIRAALQANPQASNRAIAKATGVKHDTVGKARETLEKSGAVAKMATRTDTSGRQQPARKPTREAKPAMAAKNSFAHKQVPQPLLKNHQDLEAWVIDIRQQIKIAALELDEKERAALFSALRQCIDNLEREVASHSGIPKTSSEFPDLPECLDRRGR